MRPPGPPPYTAEQIANITDPTAAFVAQAELASYVEGHKQADVSESQRATHSGPTRSSWRGNGRAGRAYHPYYHPQRPVTESTDLCPAFTSTGKCTRPVCPNIHDTNQQALCKPFLFGDQCSKGDICRLSHHPTVNNTPTCRYYRDGRCNKSSCHFAHVDVEEYAQVCDGFGRLGYCVRGDDCKQLHVYECPSFSNSGSCAAGNFCRLRHIVQAERMKAAGRRASPSESPFTTPDRIKAESHSHATNPQLGSHAISQQHDFVPLER